MEAARPTAGRDGGGNEMASSGKLWCALAMGAAAFLLGGEAMAQLPESAQLPTAEEHPTATLPEASPHWVYLLEPVFPHLIVTKVWIVDGDSLGTVTVGGL